MLEAEEAAEKKYAAPHAAALKETARPTQVAKETQKRFRAESEVRQRLDTTLSQLKNRLQLASSTDQTDFIQNNENPRWKETLELPVLIPSDGVQGNVNVIILSDLQADDVPDMDTSHRSTSDPYLKAKLVMGIDNTHVLELELWDKNWKKDDEMIAKTQFKTPSYYTKKKGNFVQSLKCVTMATRTVAFRCNYEWTECHLSQVVKKHAKKKKKRSLHKTAHKMKLKVDDNDELD